MNPRRKMCTLRKIDKVTSIDGADRIECARVDGWACVVGKGDFKPGDFAVYFEIDSFLPTGDPRYAQFAKRGEKTMVIHGTPTSGHVLRTAKFMGQISQGFLAKPQDILPDIPESAYETIYERKSCLDGPANVCEYVPMTSATMSTDFIGRYDSRVAPRTDAERVQNIDQETFDIIKKTFHYASVKVDGTSITMCHDAQEGRFRIFSHNNEFDVSKPGIAMTAMNCAKEQGLYDWCMRHPNITLQCELCGPKIQSNPLRLKRHRLYVFSVWDMSRRCYIDPYDSEEMFGENLTEQCVPLLHYDFLSRFETPDDLVEWVDGIKDNVQKGVLDEGIVIHVHQCGLLDDSEYDKLHSALGDTLQMKAISNRFLLKKAR